MDMYLIFDTDHEKTTKHVVEKTKFIKAFKKYYKKKRVINMWFGLNVLNKVCFKFFTIFKFGNVFF